MFREGFYETQTKEERSYYSSPEYRRQRAVVHLLYGAKSRAKQKGLPFNLKAKDITIPEVCPYLKVSFRFGTLYAPSLDRIKPELGYVKGNVEVISRKANMMKQNATTEELLEFAYEILDRY